MNMIEKVARSLTDQMEDQDEALPSSIQRDKGLVWLEGWFDIKAAIQAMREPSDGMWEAAKQEEGCRCPCCINADYWQAMIDAALEDKTQ